MKAEREYYYYNFLITLSKMYEKEEVGYAWYGGPHLTVNSILAPLYDKYLEKVGKPLRWEEWDK